MRNVLTLTLFVILLASCRKPYFLATDFKERTINHQIIAVLPVQIVSTGKMPKDLTPEDLRKIDSLESRVFMTALYNEVLSSSTRKKSLYIKVQSYTTTLSILEENNIDIKSSWARDPAELAAILGADAVVQSKVIKQRYISDLASYGISVGVRVAQTIAGGVLGAFIPNNLARTNDVNVSFAVVNKSDASTLYARDHFSTIDYRSRPFDVVRFGARKFGQRFPYRKTEKQLQNEK
jgi:hypothetical protein